MLMVSRRSVLISPVLVGIPISARAAEICNLKERASISTCAKGCNSVWDTVHCQYDVLFPSPAKLKKGILAGAVLGGIIAWASGDVSILTGVLIGGAIGGIAASATSYFDYRLSVANNDAATAFDAAVADKEGDEDRLERFQLSDALDPLLRDYKDAAAEFAALPSQSVPLAKLSKGVRDTLDVLEKRRKIVTSGVVGAAQAPDIGQRALKRLSSLTGMLAPTTGSHLLQHQEFRMVRATQIAQASGEIERVLVR